jgi:hypothetical protein
LEELAGALLYHIRRKQTSYNNSVLTLLRPLKLIISIEIIKRIFVTEPTNYTLKLIISMEIIKRIFITEPTNYTLKLRTDQLYEFK